jgi:hypothetical protein
MNTSIFNLDEDIPIKTKHRVPSWLKKLGVLALTTLGWFGNQVYARYKGMDDTLRIHSESLTDVKWEIVDLRRELVGMKSADALTDKNIEKIDNKVDKIGSKLDKWFEEKGK